MNNRNQFEYVGKIFNVKERQTAKGYMYIFSVPINGQTKDGETELTEWMQGVIFTKERIALKDKGEAHFTAQLEVKPPWGDKPASIGFTGFSIEPVFGQAYRVPKPKDTRRQEQPEPEYDYIPM